MTGVAKGTQPLGTRTELPSTSLNVLTLYSPFGKVMHMHQAVRAMTLAAVCTLGLLHVHIIGQLC